MNKAQAQALVDALTRSEVPGLEAQDVAIVDTTYQAARGKEPILGVFRLQRDDVSMYLIVNPWNKHRADLFHLSVLRTPSAKPAMRIHRVNGGQLTWTYGPSRHDGRNSERKKRFAQEFGSERVRLPLLTDPNDVPAFVDVLCRAMRARNLVHGAGGKQPAEPTTEAAGWIFQATPDQYDLAGALQALDELVWEVRQCADRAKVGAPVFLWLAGKDGGLLGRAEIASADNCQAV